MFIPWLQTKLRRQRDTARVRSSLIPSEGAYDDHRDSARGVSLLELRRRMDWNPKNSSSKERPQNPSF